MKSLKVVLAASVAAVSLLGCNTGQPRIYRVAIDDSSLAALPANCYVDNSTPGTQPGSTRVVSNNFRLQQDWTIWDGVEGKQYLDMGPGKQSWPLGQAAPIEVSAPIEGADNTFTGTLTESENPDSTGYSSVRTRIITVTFDNQGASPTGTIRLNSKYTCSNCGDKMNTIGHRECQIDLNFTGRRIDTSNETIYLSSP